MITTMVKEYKGNKDGEKEKRNQGRCDQGRAEPL